VAAKVQERDNSLVAVHQDNHKHRSCHDHAGGAVNGILIKTAEAKARARAKALAKGKARVSNRNSGRDNSHNRGGNLRRSDHMAATKPEAECGAISLRRQMRQVWCLGTQGESMSGNPGGAA
jgi:hypothetical protein